MKIQTKNIIICVLSITSIAITAYVNYNADREATHLADQQAEVTKVIQRHMNGDMMHDAIRGDVLQAMNLIRLGDRQRLSDNINAFNDHYATFTKVVDDNAAASYLPGEVKQNIAAIQGQIKEYGDAAMAVLTQDSPEKMEAALPRFQVSFKALEDSQEIVSTHILNLSEELNKELHRTADESKLFMNALQFFNFLMSLILVIFAITMIFRPLRQMMEAMHHIADGNTSAAIPHTKRTDEMGDMARTVEVFKENALRVAQLAEDQQRKETEGAVQRKKDMNTMADSFEANVKGVVDMVASAATEMDATSKSVASIADGNKNKLRALTVQIDGTSRNVQMVASATTQLSSAINEISSQISRAASITASAVTEAEAADTTVAGLTAAAQKIGEVLEMINSIAAQINLLALNATIEAARAGDAGKGFAVVASEVKNLASQTTKATEEISQYITSIQGATSDTVGVIKNIGGKIREINTIATSIAGAVEEQGVATKDIAANVQQASDNTVSVSKNAGEVSSSSAETGEAATQMMAATSELSRQSETLRREVDKFLSGVRTG